MALFRTLAIFGAGYAAAWFLDPDKGASRKFARGAIPTEGSYGAERARPGPGAYILMILDDIAGETS